MEKNWQMVKPLDDESNDPRPRRTELEILHVVRKQPGMEDVCVVWRRGPGGELVSELRHADGRPI